MRRNLIWIKANIKRSKGNVIGIFLLMFIISVTFCAVLAIWSNANDYEHQELARLGYGTITKWVAGVPDENQLITQIQNMEEVERVENKKVLYANFWMKGKQRDETGLITAYDPVSYDYHIFNEQMTGFQSNPTPLHDHEVYVPAVFAADFDLAINDVLTIKLNEQQSEQYIVKGFFEDPVMGSSVMGIKTILMEEATQKELMKKAGEQEDTTIRIGNELHIFQQGNTLSANEFQSRLNEQTDMKNYTVFSYGFDTVAGFMLIMQDVFSGFLLLFVMVLLIVAMLVLGHSISSSIDQEYVDIGIMKAIGFSNRNLRNALILQYLGIILLGLLCGVPISTFVVQLVNQITITSTGLLIPSQLPWLLCTGLLILILLFAALFIYLKTVRLAAITPIRAIRQDRGDIYFKSRVHAPVSKRALELSLAFRQLTSGKKQYISAGIVSILLVFFLSFTMRLSIWAGPNGEGLINAFAAAPSDFDIKTTDSAVLKEALKKISMMTPIESTYQFVNIKGEVNHVNYIMNIISDPSYYQMLKGRTCLHDDEAVVTEFLAKELNVAIGDLVTISYEGNSADYIISGINQCANDMGGNFSITQQGFSRLSDQELAMGTSVILKDAGKKKMVLKELKETFQDRIECNDNTWSGMENVVSVMSALNTIMFGIVLFFIFVVILLTGSKVLHNEQHDLGIYKALGFSTRRMRLAFALRFGIVAAIGSGFGIIISALISDAISTSFLKMIGISQFVSHPSLIQILAPGMIVTILFVIFAYLEARKIKRIEPILLINE